MKIIPTPASSEMEFSFLEFAVVCALTRSNVFELLLKETKFLLEFKTQGSISA